MTYTNSYLIQEQAGSGTNNYYIPVGDLCELSEVRIVAGTTSTAHNDNHVIITIKGANGTTALATRSTDANGGGSTLTAGTLENLGIADASQAVFTSAQKIHVESVQAGSGVAVNATLCFVFKPARLQS